MTVVAPVVFGIVLIAVGTVLLSYHKRVRAFWEGLWHHVGIASEPPRWWSFSVYQLGPLALIVGGVVVILIRLLGVAGIGPAA